MQIEFVTDGRRLAELQPCWNDLWQSAGGSAYQHHGWIAAWAEHSPRAVRLQIAIAHRHGEILAALPFQIRSWYGIRMLEWCGQSISDYCDGLGAGDLLPALWAATLKQGGFDLVRLKNIAPDARIHDMLQAYQPDRVVPRHRHDVCPKIASRWPNGDGWYRNLNRKKKSNHSRALRNLSEFGEYSVRQVTCIEEAAPIVGQLIAFKRAWLAATGLGSPLLDGNDKLVPALVAAMAEAGLLRLFTLCANGRLVAGSVNLLHDRRMLAFFAGYDATFERASPGITLMTEYTKWAFSNGVEEIDYLRGAEAYKFEFANTAVRLDSCIKARTWRGALFRRAYAAAASHNGSSAEEIPEFGAAYVTRKGSVRLPGAEELPVDGDDRHTAAETA